MLALPSMKSFADSAPLPLVCHPRTPSRGIRGIDVVAGGSASGILTLAFILEGNLSGLRIPEPRASRCGHGLWQHTCFEAFVMAKEGAGYREFNFSPSGEWAAYTFRGYRDGGELDIDMAPIIAVHRSVDRLELHAEIRPDCLPPGRSLQLGLSAVVEDADGVLSYWALRHPPGKPDFHHADAFALQLPGPECVT
jgi:hypothetical protein